MQATEAGAVEELARLCAYFVEGLENEGLAGSGWADSLCKEASARAIAEVERLRADVARLEQQRQDDVYEAWSNDRN